MSIWTGTLIEDGQYIWIRLKYTLTDGSTLERGYNVPVRRLPPSTRPSTR